MNTRLSVFAASHRQADDGGRSGTPGIALRASAIGKWYGEVRALDGIDLEVRRGEMLTLLGPSGSGKTTLLKAIAGFEPFDEGILVLDGRDLSNIAPARREIGMVFQHYALFPHLSVEQNVAFPLRMRGLGRRAIRQRVADILAKVELSQMADRYPQQLSGGQQQRVALARAVVFGPKLLLLDEPFGALDRKLREVMQAEVRALQRDLELTTVFITHDQEEALAMSDRIAVMQSGRIVQLGTPAQIYASPASEFTARFVGESNLLAAQVIGEDGPHHVVALAASHARIHWRADPAALSTLRPGANVSLLLRPEAVLFAPPAGEAANRIEARLIETTYLGGSTRWLLRTPEGATFIVRTAGDAATPQGGPGDIVPLYWRVTAGHLVGAGAAA